MLFNSFAFLFFFPTVFLITFLLPVRWRNLFLIAASYYFYMYWKASYALILVAITVFDYFAAIAIERSQSHRAKTWILASAITLNLGLLFFFKYFNFFASEANLFMNRLGLEQRFQLMHIVLPLGISFHTFQAIGYTIDVYRGGQKAEKNFETFALFIAYFPQMIAGPIERARNLLPQLSVWRPFTYENASLGFRLMLWGFFKKVVIADNLSVAVDLAYRHPTEVGKSLLVAAVYLFPLQIFCDFSGYTDIARGSAQIFGVNLAENFKRPFFARNIPEYWSRWHISLTTWFWEYLYYPICYHFPTVLGTVVAAIFVFSVSGIWHGANWTYVIWGLLSGIFYVTYTLVGRPIAGYITEKFQNKSERWSSIGIVLSILLTYHCIAFCLIYFRASSVADANGVIAQLVSFESITFSDVVSTLGAQYKHLKYGLIALLILFYVGRLEEKHDQGMAILMSSLSQKRRWATYVLLIYSTVFFGNLGNQQFIYFQF